MAQEIIEVNPEVAAQSEMMGVAVYRDPELVLAEARRAAVALQNVLNQKKDPVIFNKQQYLEFEDWQTVAKFYGVSAKVVSTGFVDFGGVQGFEARAVAVVNATGVEISAADSMCLNDEERWRSRAVYEWRDGPTGKRERVKVGEEPVPLFQLRSMAQTRACAKALRSVFAWVVVLAGYKPTVAEELTGTEEPPAAAPVQQPQRKEGPAPAAGDVISEAQAKRFYAIYKGAGISDDDAQAYLLKEYGIEHSRDILKRDYDKIVAWAQKGGKAA